MTCSRGGALTHCHTGLGDAITQGWGCEPRNLYALHHPELLQVVWLSSGILSPTNACRNGPTASIYAWTCGDSTRAPLINELSSGRSSKEGFSFERGDAAERNEKIVTLGCACVPARACALSTSMGYHGFFFIRLGVNSKCPLMMTFMMTMILLRFQKMRLTMKCPNDNHTRHHKP